MCGVWCVVCDDGTTSVARRHDDTRCDTIRHDERDATRGATRVASATRGANGRSELFANRRSVGALLRRCWGRRNDSDLSDPRKKSKTVYSSPDLSDKYETIAIAIAASTNPPRSDWKYPIFRRRSESRTTERSDRRVCARRTPTGTRGASRGI